jgi:hypothetical protein
LIASALGPSFAMISTSASREIDQPLDGRNRHPDMPPVERGRESVRCQYWALRVTGGTLSRDPPSLDRADVRALPS